MSIHNRNKRKKANRRYFKDINKVYVSDLFKISISSNQSQLINTNFGSAIMFAPEFDADKFKNIMSACAEVPVGMLFGVSNLTRDEEKEMEYFFKTVGWIK